MKIGIIGIGFVGKALLKSFSLNNIDVTGYDKFNPEYNNIEKLFGCDIIFLCLPTPFNDNLKKYNLESIDENIKILSTNNFKGLVVLKSTVTPETTNNLSLKYSNLKICHNPEFLTAKTAFEDFHNQKHIVIGKGPNNTDKDLNILNNFYKKYYPNAEISNCLAIESESMKLFCNSFYASKIMLFNEYYLLCQKNNSDFNTIKDLMLKNNWINSMHTRVPGNDDKLAYGGACFPKDTKALNEYMKEKNSCNYILENVIKECNIVRK